MPLASRHMQPLILFFDFEARSLFLRSILVVMLICISLVTADVIILNHLSNAV